MIEKKAQEYFVNVEWEGIQMESCGRRLCGSVECLRYGDWVAHVVDVGYSRSALVLSKWPKGKAVYISGCLADA